jgi:predicted nuclease with TOPRIM domain
MFAFAVPSPMGIAVGILAVCFVVAVVLAIALWRRSIRSEGHLARYQEIVDVEAYVASQKATLERHKREQVSAFEKARRELTLGIERLCVQLENVRSEYDAVAASSTELRREVTRLEEAQELQSFGFYQARYSLETPDEYKAKLEEVRAAQEHMIADDAAVWCPSEWTVNGSAKDGRKMICEQTKLMLRAFNGESDAAIAKIKYNNAESLENRIKSALAAINKLGSVQRTAISDGYAALKLNELYLAHEYQEKLQEEREEQRRLREQLREAERAEKEIEEAVAQAQNDEEKFARALQAAHAEVRDATGKHLDRLEKLVAKLQSELAGAIDRKARAIARAQLVKSGHVYVLSNVGSFGDGVYKIGMTRRFDPLERVRELGVASVPFDFDVHAMIYCEDAPKLENLLHREFTHRRVNRINLRREYFKVTLDEVRRAVAKHHGIVAFVLEAEAEEFRKTTAMIVPANDLAARGA